MYLPVREHTTKHLLICNCSLQAVLQSVLGSRVYAFIFVWLGIFCWVFFVTFFCVRKEKPKHFASSGKQPEVGAVVCIVDIFVVGRQTVCGGVCRLLQMQLYCCE